MRNISWLSQESVMMLSRRTTGSRVPATVGPLTPAASLPRHHVDDLEVHQFESRAWASSRR